MFVRSEPESAQPPQTDPKQWSRSRKILSVAILAYAECLTFLVSMIMASSVPQVLQTFHTSEKHKFLGSFAVTVYVLGFLLGPLLLAPITDLIGRIHILRFTSVLFVIFVVACALSSSLPMLIVFRFFAGSFGGAPTTIGGGVVSDLYEPGERSRPMSWYSMGNAMGPILGPILGGVVTGSLSWRWGFWIGAMLASIFLVSVWLLLRETHPATLAREAGEASTVDQGAEKANSGKMAPASTPQNISRTFVRSITIPFKITCHPPAFAILLHMFFFNGITNMIISTLDSVFQFQYHFPPTTAGLSYLGFGLGGIVGFVATPYINNFFVSRSRREGQEQKSAPYLALPVMIISSPLASAGLFWYGWSCERKLHWLLPISGLSLFGFAFSSIRLATQIFLIEAVPGFSASALAALVVTSSIGGPTIPIGTFPLYDRLGYGWGNSVIALVNLFLWLIPLIMYAIARRSGKDWILRIEI